MNVKLFILRYAANSENCNRAGLITTGTNSYLRLPHYANERLSELFAIDETVTSMNQSAKINILIVYDSLSIIKYILYEQSHSENRHV